MIHSSRSSSSSSTAFTPSTPSTYNKRTNYSSPNNQKIIKQEELEDEEAKNLADFFDTTSISISYDTPPISTPSSPDYSDHIDRNYEVREVGDDKVRRRIEIAPSSSSSQDNDRDGNQIKLNEVHMIDNVSDRITSPVLPKVKLAFPTIMSDEEDDLPIWNGLSGSVGRRGPNLSNASDLGRDTTSNRSRTWSQNSQTTTTTTLRTKKTEHRSYRYSMPSFDSLNDEYGKVGTSNEVSTPRSHSSNSARYSTSTKNSNNSNSQIPFPSSGSNRRTTTTSFHNPTPRSTRTSVPIRETRRSSPLPPFPPSFNSTSTPSKSTISNPFDAIFHRRPSTKSNRSSSYHSHLSDSSSFDPNYKIPSQNSRSNQMTTSMRNASLPLVAPLMNMFMFFIVTSIACCSISAVLAAGFGLTLYDDCGRRVKLLREGIEGVSLTNMGRIVGGAVGEWAKEATKRLKAGSSGIRTVRVRVNRRREDTSEEEEEEEGNDRESRSTSPVRSSFETEEVNSDGVRYKSNFERNMSSRSRSRIRRKSNSPAVSSSSNTSLAKRFPTRFFPQFFSNPSIISAEQSRNEDLRTQGEDWFSDDDNLPYEVPTSTPHPSRPSSPPPSPPATSSSSSQSSSNPTRPLPPRPPFSLLVPSIIFALIYTLIKVTFDYWRGNRRPRSNTRDR